MNELADQLLPVGFHDTLAPDARRELEVTYTLLTAFHQHGYGLVKPPLAEHDVVPEGTQRLPTDYQAFRMMDPDSHAMLAIRSDMTPQIARIVNQRMGDMPRPIRLAYSGQVLRTKGDGLHGERQLAQAGIELIGSSEPSADREVLHLALEGLLQVGVGAITLDLILPRLMDVVLRAFDTPGQHYGPLYKAVYSKNDAEIRAIADPASTLLADLCAVTGPAEQAIAEMRKLSLPDEASVMVDEAEQFVASLDLPPEVMLTIDPLEATPSGYYTGLAFSFFSGTTGEELGRGGRYKLPDSKEDAVGFTLSVNRVLRCVNSESEGKTVLLSSTVEEAEAQKLREEGYITVRTLTDMHNLRKEADRLGCVFIYEDGEVRK